MRAAGYVLVGGNSSRMGTDKAFLPGQFRYLVDDLAECVKSAVGNVTLIGDPDRHRELHYPCIPDLRPGLGPLAGLEAALTSTNSGLNLVLACDMPAIDVVYIRSLLERARASSTSCVAIQDAIGNVHPLCAVYKKECLPVIQCRLDEKRLALMGLLDAVPTEYVRIQSVIANINTPEDWARWSLREQNGTEPACKSVT